MRRWLPPLWHVAIALLVAAPLMRGGYLLLLDFALIRRVEVVWFASAAHPGPTNSAPASAVLWMLAKFGYAAGPLLVFALFLTMGLAMHHAAARLVAPRLRLAPYFAGTLYAVNPWTYERLMHGHVLLLAAYALLPLVLLAALRLIERPDARRAGALALVIVGIAWTSIHVLAMLPLLLLAIAVTHRAAWRAPVARWAGVALLIVLAANLWWLPGLASTPPGQQITTLDLEAYATRPAGASTPGTVAALYGFWRHEFRLPKDGVTAWWLLFLPLAGLTVYGLVATLRDPATRGLGVAFVILIPASILLASGISFPPTAGAFRWAFEHLPGFKVFREPQKWVALLPLAYGLLGSAGLDRLLGGARAEAAGRDRALLRLAAAVALVLPLTYAWTLVWNWDRLRPTRLPAGWEVADRTMREQGGGTMLFLPWHLYLTMEATGFRVVNPAPSYFSVPVIAGDNVELGPIRTQSQDPVSRLVETVVYADGSRDRALDVFASLGVRWIVLAREADHAEYGWLADLDGLDLIYRDGAIQLWRMPP